MFTIKKFVTVDSLDEAYLLNQARSNAILGGTLWMKMGNRVISKAVDLGRLGLDQIEENEEEFIIGCMCSLRDLEVHEGLDACFHGFLKEALKHIVGVQFRNCATVGGSIFSRFGFSDVITALLALDTYVELYQGGTIPLAKFLKMSYDNDILVHIIIKKKVCQTAYLSHRNTKTDFPVLTMAAVRDENQWKIVLGARPMRAVLVDAAGKLPLDPSKEDIQQMTKWAAEQIKFGSNMRASEDYRRLLSGVLMERGIKKVVGGK